jgi:hypothetical protein
VSYTFKRLLIRRFIVKLALKDVNEEDRGVIAPCGIICLGCDVHQDESLEAAKRVIEIWEGMNLPDVSGLVGMKAQEILDTLKTLKEYVDRREKTGACPGCFKGGGPSAFCSVAKCVKSKGYWTCAECEDCNLESEHPCPHSDTGLATTPLGSRQQTSALIRKRYNSNNTENLKKCLEIGYSSFITETREKVRTGWRTWQVISSESLFPQR